MSSEVFTVKVETAQQGGDGVDRRFSGALFKAVRNAGHEIRLQRSPDHNTLFFTGNANAVQAVRDAVTALNGKPDMVKAVRGLLEAITAEAPPQRTETGENARATAQIPSSAPSTVS